MADPLLLQLLSEVLLKVFKDVQDDIPKELQRTLHGLALTARKLLPMALEVLLEHPIAVKTKSIEFQSFQPNQHLVTVTSPELKQSVQRLLIDPIPHFTLSRADKQQWSEDLIANHTNALFGVLLTILPKDTELRLSARELHHLSFLSVLFQPAHIGADLVATWQQPRSWGRAYLNAAFKARSCHVHTLYLPVGWCRDFLLENAMAMPKLRRLMCMSSLHYVVISDAAIESLGIFELMLSVTIKSIVIVDAGPCRPGVSRNWHVDTLLRTKSTERYSALARITDYYKEPTKRAFHLVLFDRARALGVEVKIWHSMEIRFTSKNTYWKTFIFSDDELAQLEEFKKDVSGYI